MVKPSVEYKMSSGSLASNEQIARIVELYAQKRLSSDVAQACIDASESGPSAKNQATKERLFFWDEKFRGKGAAIMEVLRPFYDWRPGLKPALPDLEERAKRGVFWREVTGVRMIPLSEAASLRDSLRASLEDSLWASLRDSLGDSLWASLWHSIRASLWASHWASLRDSHWEWLRDSLGVSLGVSLYYPLVYVLVGRPDEALKFRVLHQLWLAGNYPVGFDEEGNLLVLVA